MHSEFKIVLGGQLVIESNTFLLFFFWVWYDFNSYVYLFPIQNHLKLSVIETKNLLENAVFSTNYSLDGLK